MTHRPTPPFARGLFALGAVGLAATVYAAPETFVSDPAQSSAVGSLIADLQASGTLIGDFDPVTNPGGTSTLPGLFGGSGNQPVPLTVDGEGSSSFDLVPAGSFTLDFDTTALTATIESFSADLLNGETVIATLEAELGLTTFRTINPNFIIPGVPLTVPIGDATISGLTAVQSGPQLAPGVLVPVGDGTFTLAAIIPVDVTVAGDALGNPLGGTSTIDLPVAATIDPTGSPTVVRAAIDLAQLSQDFPPDLLPPIVDLPFDLPLPTGETAGILLNLDIDGAGIVSMGAADLVAIGQGPAGCNIADLAEPFGQLTFGDIGAFLNAFNTGDPAADLAEPFGQLTFGDIGAFLGAFDAGCP
jgi:hypothetical protein